MLLSKAIEGYVISSLADGYSPLTIAAYKSAIKIMADYLHDPDVNTITSEDLKRFMGHLRTTYKPKRSDNGELSTASLHRYWKAIRSFYKWASVDLNTGRPDKALVIPRFTNKEISPFTEEEIKLLLKACKYSRPIKSDKRKTYQYHRQTENRDKALIMILLDTGIRVGECGRLKVQDVNLESGEIQIYPYRVGKTRPRIVIIGKATRKMLWHYLTERSANQDEPLFITPTGASMNRYSILRMVSATGVRAGVQKVHPHRFRHTFAIQFLRNGGDVFTLQRFLGHSTLEMVRHYLAIANADSEKAHRKASPVDRWQL